MVRLHPIVLVGALSSALACACWIAHAAQARPALPGVGYVLVDGSKATTDQLRGKVVLVNFWAPSCSPCVAEMPQLMELQRRFGPQGYETLTVAVQQEPPANVFRYVDAEHFQLPVAIDLSGDFAKRYGPVDATPTTILVDRRGRQAARYEGRLDVPVLRRSIARLLAER